MGAASQFTSPTDAALARCSEITLRRPTHLATAAEAFDDDRRRELFLCSYAAMRVADDLVDEDFLALSSDERDQQRVSLRHKLDRWLAQCVQATHGAFDLAATEQLEPLVFSALNERLPASSIGEAPWRSLHASLTRDANERPIEKWKDFLEYSEGACVAPATIFVYLAGCRFDESGASVFSAQRPADEFARDLALFSYLVHLRRDLHADAQSHEQLVLLPREWLTDCGVSSAEALQQIREGKLEKVAPALARLRTETLHYRERALPMLDEARSELGESAAATLERVFQLYDEAFEAFSRP
jgi:phytoene/squalene synthetase